MNTSRERIPTTHVGSLPRLSALLALLPAKSSGQPYERALLDAEVTKSVDEIVERQSALGVDIVSDAFAGDMTIHDTVVWAKLAALAEGARCAGQQLGFHAAA